MRKLRSPLCLLAAVLTVRFTETTIWLAFGILAIVFLKIDFFPKSDSTAEDGLVEDSAFEFGEIGKYTVDQTEVYGLFIKLLGSPVFVDIKNDGQLAEREIYAKHLYENREILEVRLTDFISRHPEFEHKKVAYIGLHSKKKETGEVFWNPDGYTGLTKLELSA